MNTLREKWDKFNSLFLGVKGIQSFSSFLENYHGVETFDHEFSDEDKKVFVDSFCKLMKVSAEKASSLEALEKNFNLALYYWDGEDDRNYQFRTLVDFFHLRGEFHWNLTFYPQGISFSQSIPKSSFVSEAFPLTKDIISSESLAFARIRSLQRETILLVDEWEHRNAIMAVSVLALRRSPDPDKQSALLEERNEFALWCMESVLNFQKYSKTLREKNFSPDTLNELKALDALLLASVQKFYLPASVSRHRYPLALAQKILDWTYLRSEKEDVGLQLTRFAMSCALQKELAEHIDFFHRPCHEWGFSHDPSSSIKCFAWSMSDDELLMLSGLFLHAVMEKLNPSPVDEYWIVNAVSCLQMKRSFPGEVFKEDRLFPLSDIERGKFLEKFNRHLEKIGIDSPESQFLKSIFGALL